MPTSADVFQLSIVYTGGGEYMECVQHFLSSNVVSSTPAADALALMAGFVGNVQGTMLNCWYPDVTLIGYRSKRVNNGGGPQVIQPAPSGTIGTATGATALPTTRQAAVIANDYYQSAATKPKWEEGRMFLGGVPAAFWIDNMWSSIAITAYQALMTALQTTFGSSPSWSYGTWSKKYSTIYTGGNLELSGRMGHQKRRVLPRL